MDVHLFGELDVDLGTRRLHPRSFRGRKPKQLFEVLLVHRGHPVPTDQIAALLWGDDAPPDFASTVQHYVSLLRRALPRCPVRGSVVVTASGGYTLDESRMTLDLDRFDAAVAAAELAGPAERRALLTGALDLVRGEVLADEPDAGWALELRASYQRSYLEVLLQACAAALRDADADVALALARTAVNHDPYSETAACLLMAAHYLVGDGRAALAGFEQCRRGLADVLGIDPTPQTLVMQRAVLRHAPVAELLADALRMARAHRPGGALRASA